MNEILKVDSYKASHYKQLPEGTEATYFYIESRGGEFPETVFFGLQPLLKRWESLHLTMDDVREADDFFERHGEPFPIQYWRYIVNEYDGAFPVRIRAVREGTVVPTHNALVTVESTDPMCTWLPGWLETQLVRQVWYATTVATLSRECKKLIYSALLKSSDDPNGQIAFKLHDFGGRGVSSGESAQIGGAAHLVNFLGSDTVEAVVAANEWYLSSMSAFSIPAMEHSTVTAWGRNGEVDAYRNMLNQYAKPGALIACVSDSYDIWNAIDNIWGEQLREKIIDSGATVVIRLDSGDPAYTVAEALSKLDAKFGSVVNGKGFKVLKHVRVLQGDGINYRSIPVILNAALERGYSADNIAFGMGGGLLQQVNRDTLNFAMKMSAIKRDGVWRGVSKSPVGSEMKRSKSGRFSLVADPTFRTVPYSEDTQDMLETVFDNGVVLRSQSFDEVRHLASL